MTKTRSLASCLESLDLPQRRLEAHLQELPFPHYEPAADSPGLMVRIEAHGRKTVGRFVNRTFQAVSPGS